MYNSDVNDLNIYFCDIEILGATSQLFFRATSQLFFRATSQLFFRATSQLFFRATSFFFRLKPRKKIDLRGLKEKFDGVFKYSIGPSD